MPIQIVQYVPMKPTKSKRSMLALIVINRMGIRSQALSSRQRAPPSVYQSANGVRAQLQVGKSQVKGGIAALGRRPWALGRGERGEGGRGRLPAWAPPIDWALRRIWEAPMGKH